VDRGHHVTVPRTCGHARRSAVRVHRRNLDPAEHDGVATGLLRTVVDCARELPLREAVVICDAALRVGLGLAQLTEAVRRLRGPGATAARRALALCDPSAESALESCARLLLVGLGQVQPQVCIPGVGRVDFLVDGWLVVEVDGFEFHSSRQEYREDRRRANALAARGFVVLRFSYEDVVHHPVAVIGIVQSVLAGRS
jgi:very-short-patch-repair endonuclease